MDVNETQWGKKTVCTVIKLSQLCIVWVNAVICSNSMITMLELLFLDSVRRCEGMSAAVPRGSWSTACVYLYLQPLHFVDLVFDSFLQGRQDPQLSVYLDLHVGDSLAQTLGQVVEVVVTSCWGEEVCVRMSGWTKGKMLSLTAEVLCQRPCGQWMLHTDDMDVM